MDSPQVSIIVPSYNARKTMLRCLETLRGQKTDLSYEIIVVDSSNDGTAELIESQYPQINLIRLSERTLPGAARNFGIQAARGEILAFTDSDCLVEPSWLSKMVQAHAAEHCAAVGGPVINGLPLNPIAWSGYFLEFNEQLPSIPKRFAGFLPTCNVSFKASVFRQYGLFPANLWPSEDSIFAWSLCRAGETFLFDPEIRVRHLFRSTFGSFMRHQVRLGEASAIARKQVDLPYAWAATHPLRWFVPLVRLARIEARLVRCDFISFLSFNLLLPLNLSGLCAWGVGFCKASRLDTR
jgi:glycosyltransferase involved in cell wall biosynthesis